MARMATTMACILSNRELLVYFLEHLDFDDEPADAGQPTGLAATQVLAQTSPAATNLIMGTSANPLDDLVSIFGSATLSPQQSTPAPAQAPFGFAASPMAPSPAPVQNGNATSPQAAQNPQEDLLGLF